MIIAKFLLAMLIGYLLGSIPFGVLVAKRKKGVDVRNFGSGKTGATNVLRTAGKKAALAVAALDISKGVLSVVFAGLIVGSDFLVIGGIGLTAAAAQVLAALASVVGHIWPVFCRFRGGRGVATYFGGLVALYPAAGLFGGEIVIIGAGLTRFASLGSIAGAVAAYALLIPLTLMNGFPIMLLVYAFIGTVLVICMHRDNIKRLLAGKERKLGETISNTQTTPPA